MNKMFIVIGIVSFILIILISLMVGISTYSCNNCYELEQQYFSDPMPNPSIGFSWGSFMITFTFGAVCMFGGGTMMYSLRKEDKKK